MTKQLLPILLYVTVALATIPFYLKSIPPNAWSGFRSSETLSDPELWFIVNRIAAKGTFLCCLVSLALNFLIDVKAYVFIGFAVSQIVWILTLNVLIKKKKFEKKRLGETGTKNL